MVITKGELVQWLRDMADSVDAADSFEGSLTYSIAPASLEHPFSFEVESAYRIGNSMGQGGLRLIQ